MTTEVRGVVSRRKGEPVTVETVLVPDPGPGEAVVDVQACGVCHTDLHYREGGISDDYPFLLGHEAAGTVTAVGDGVTEVQPGDYVILNWRAVCGTCRACARGRPWYCFNTHNATQRMTLEDGTELSPALGIGALAEKTLVAAGQCTKVDPEAPATAAGLLGCGVMAGLGAAINTGGVTRGDTVAVYGCGGVGAAAVAGARLAGARTVIGVDVDRRKLGAARSLGATHAVNAAEEDPVEAIKKATDGFGADVVIEAIGGPRRTSRRSIRVIWPARWCWSACRRRRCGWRCRCWTSSATAARSSRPGMATACPRATSPCSSTSTGRVGSTSTGSSRRRSPSTRSRTRSPRCTGATCSAQSSCSEHPEHFARSAYRRVGPHLGQCGETSSERLAAVLWCQGGASVGVRAATMPWG